MRRRNKRKVMSEINVVPYIDVMLVLLVIFMITAPLLSQGVNVELPQAAAKPLPAPDKEPVVISIDGIGNYFVNYGDSQDKPIPLATLVNRVAALRRYQPKIPIYVKGDRKVDYGRVVELMALLQGSGVEGVGLVTTPPGT